MSEVTLLILDLPEWMALGHTLCLLNIPTEKNPVGLNQGNAVAKRSPSWTKSVYNQMFSVTSQELA